MAYLYLPEAVSATLCSEKSSPDTEQSAMSKMIRSVSRILSKASRQDLLTMLQSGTISEPLIQRRIREWLTSFSGDSPVSLSLSLARTKEQMTREIAGPIPSESLAKYDPDTHSWKTSQLSLLTNTVSELSQTLPVSGIVVSGILYQRPSLVHPTFGIDSGYLPTPRVRNINYWDQEYAEKKQMLCDSFVGSQLNPRWVEWLMGWPDGWTDLKCSVTDKSLSVFRESLMLK